MTWLKVNNLTKKFPDKLAVDDVNFTCEKNTCVALIGPNGAGKTTTLRMLSGLSKPTSGTITLQGETHGDDLRESIGYLPQYPQFHTWMTGEEFLIYVGRLAHLRKTEATNRAKDLLTQVGLKDDGRRRIGKYSGGMKQRLGIAQSIIHKPKLLMLDEPVASLDPFGRRDVLNLMDELKKDMTILFSTHILSDADEVSDELLLLHAGKLIESGSLRNLRKKYQTTEIELAFAGDDDGSYVDALLQLPSIKTCEFRKESYYITAHENVRAGKEILTKTLEEDWELTTYALTPTPLEELFVKVVDNHAMASHL